MQLCVDSTRFCLKNYSFYHCPKDFGILKVKLKVKLLQIQVKDSWSPHTLALLTGHKFFSWET